VGLTNQSDLIRTEFIRLARQPFTVANDPGKYVAADLFQVGTSSKVAIPILMTRLEFWIAQDGHPLDLISQTC